MPQSMILPVKYLFDHDNKPLAFGKIYTYEAGTTTPKDTFDGEEGAVNPNPVILNGEGYARVYLDGSYNIVVDDQNDVNIWSEDPVSSNASQEWTNCQSATYVSPDQFSLIGDKTEQYEPGRVARIDNDTANFSYSTIEASTFGGGITTVTLRSPFVSVNIIGVCVSIIGQESIPGSFIEKTDNIQDLRALSVLNVDDNQIVFVSGYYTPGGGGGDPFFWNSTSSAAPDPGVNILPTAHVGDGRWERLVEESINVRAFGCVLDGSTDDLAAFQATADYAEANDKKIIVDGPLFTSATVDVWNSIEFIGAGRLIYIAQTVPLMHITSKNAGDSLTPTSIGGLTELSSAVTGFTPQANGFAVIDSDEELIKRITGGFYTKDELIIFSGEGGLLTVPVYEDHDTAQINTIKYYAPEPILFATGVRVTTADGLFATAAIDGMIKTSLRDVTVINLSIENIRNTGTQWLNETSPNVLMIAPRIDGSKLVSGYGIRNTITGAVTIEKPAIGRCRRGVTGRHDKNTLVTNGGYVRAEIDSHYGYNLTVSNGVMLEGAVHFAGRDVRVFGITQKRSASGIVQRNDTPEIKGIMSFCNNSLIMDTGAEFSGLTIGPASTFVFGRTLHQPDVMRFENNHLVIETGPSQIRYLWHINPETSDHFRVKSVYIGGNTIDDESFVPQAVSFMSKTDKSLGTWNTKIYYSNEKKGSIFITDKTAAFDSSWGFDVDVRSIGDFDVRIDSTALFNGKIRDGFIGRLTNETASDLSANVLGVWDIRDCDIDDLLREGHAHIMSGQGFLRLMADDEAQKISLLGYRDYGVIHFLIPGNTARGGAAWFDASEPSITALALGASAALFTVPLTGSTGTDGFINVSVNGGFLYIENRSGGNKNIYYEID